MVFESEVDVILFDLDGTLCEYRRTDTEILQLAFESLGLEQLFTIEDYFEKYRHEGYVDEYDSVDRIREAGFCDLMIELGYELSDGEELARIFASERDHSNVEFLPGAEEALEVLGERFQLGMVTNALPEMQQPKINALTIKEHFDAVVFAGYDTAPKPDTAPFEYVLDKMNATAEVAVHIGDSHSTDIMGAYEAGIQSVWIPTGPDASTREQIADYKFDSLTQLVNSFR